MQFKTVSTLLIALFMGFNAGALVAFDPPNLPEVEAFSLDPLVTTKKIIETSEKNLAAGKKLEKAMEDYKKAQATMNKDKNNKDYVEEMVKKASTVLKIITENHLEHLYSKEFIKELEFFSQYSSKT